MTPALVSALLFASVCQVTPKTSSAPINHPSTRNLPTSDLPTPNQATPGQEAPTPDSEVEATVAPTAAPTPELLPTKKDKRFETPPPDSPVGALPTPPDRPEGSNPANEQTFEKTIQPGFLKRLFRKK